MPGLRLQVRLFNSAGEQVAVLAQNLGLYTEPTGMTIQSPTLASGQMEVINLPGTGQSITWVGVNGQGQPLQSGVYVISAAIQNADGVVQTLSASVTILRAMGDVTVSIYNSAGEMVRRWTLPDNGDGMSRQPIPGGVTAYAPGGAPLAIQWGSQAGDLVAWDGSGGNGQRVQSGSYLVQVQRDDSQGRLESMEQDLLVINPRPGGAGKAMAVPNPAGRGTSQVLLIAAAASSGTGLKGWVYDLAGERVAGLSVKAPGVLCWEIASAANGVYVAVLEWTGPDGAAMLSRVKLAVSR
jgi:hypothetical protein